MTEQGNGKRPHTVLRGPHGVRLAIWTRQVQKDGKSWEVHSIAIEKTIRTPEGFRSVNSFDLRDLPAVALVAGKAYELLALRQQGNGAEEK